MKVNHFLSISDPEITGRNYATVERQLCISLVKYTVIHTRPRSIFGCTVCMNATSLVTPLAPPSYLVVPRLCLHYSQCLRTSKVLITLTTLQSQRGSSKLVYVSWFLAFSLSSQAAQMCDTLLFRECENRLLHTLWEIRDISAIFF